MTNDMYAISQAKSLLRKHKLAEVSLDNIIYLIEEQGYEIVEYLHNENNAILQQLKLESYAQGCNAFSFSGNGVKYVFVKEDIDVSDKLYALSHELGHIVCGHMKENGDLSTNVEEERQANEFAHSILHPDFGTVILSKFYENKKVSIVAVIVVIALIIMVPLSSLLIKQSGYYGEFYITETGNKYHEKNCIFVKDKNSVQRLTEKEYYSGKYDACKMCLPD